MAVLWVPLGPLPVGRLHSLYQMSSQQGSCLSLCGQRTPSDLAVAPGDSPISSELCHISRVSTLYSPFIDPNGIYNLLLSPSSLSCSVPYGCSHSLSLSYFQLECFSPTLPSVSVLSLQAKIAPYPPWLFSFPVLLSMLHPC